MLLTLKTKNLIKQAEKEAGENMDLEYHLKVSKVNDEKKGCFGFVLNRKNNKVVYVNTTTLTNDFSYSQQKKVLFRQARHTKDWQGGINRFATIEQFAQAVVGLLK